MFLIVAENLLSLCMLMAAGFALGKLNVVDKAVSAGLGRVLLNVALPCTIVMSMQQDFSAELLAGGLTVLRASLGVYLFALLCGLGLCAVLRTPKERRGVWLFAAMFPNVGYMGFPVISAVFGTGALFYASMNNVVFNVLSSTLGVSLMKGFGKKGEGKRDFPLLPVVTGVAFALFVCRLKLPVPVARALTMGGNMTTPLSMIIIGTALSRSRLSAVFLNGRDYWLAGLRLIALPFLTFLALRPFIADVEILGIIVILEGMPVAAVTAIYAQRYADAGAASRLVALTTLLSVVTLPLVALVL